MTHTPEQLKKLAEFAAEYLGWVLDDSEWYLLPEGYDFEVFSPNYHIAELPQIFFVGDVFPPTLMHLAQEKLEEEEDMSWSIEHVYRKIEKSKFYEATVWRGDDGEVYIEHENKFIAFWKATRQAKGGK